MGGYYLHLYFRPSLSSRAMIFSPGFLDTKKNPYPYFQRVKWFEEFDAVAISLADPTLSLSGEVGIGWFIGNSNIHFLKDCAAFLSKLLSHLGVKPEKTLFFGSSAGGFSSIGMAACVPGSHAFAVNPQTDIARFHSITELHRTFRACFSSGDILSISRKFKERLCLADLIYNLEYRPPMTIWQNIYDQYHYENHLIPFLAKMAEVDSFNGMEVIIASDPASGHNPPPLQVLKKRFNDIITHL